MLIGNYGTTFITGSLHDSMPLLVTAATLNQHFVPLSSSFTTNLDCVLEPANIHDCPLLGNAPMQYCHTYDFAPGCALRISDISEGFSPANATNASRVDGSGCLEM